MTLSLDITESQLIRDALSIQLPISFKGAIAFTQDDQLLLVTQDQERAKVQFIDPTACGLAFAESAQDSGWIAASTLRHGRMVNGNWVLQFHPPQRYSMTCAIDRQFQPQKGTEVRFSVKLPGLLFFAIGHRAYLWATSNRTFTPLIQLHHAPLPNVSQTGELCFGSNVKPAASLQTVNQIWQTWWDGIFTAHHVNGKSRQHPQDIRQLLWQNRERKTYDIKDLIKTNKTAQQMVEQITRR